jgi:pyrroline-5-carboxylate reductase
MIENKKIAIIGAGNLGSSIIKGLLRSGKVKPENISATDKRPQVLESLTAMGIKACCDNKQAVATSDIIIVVVKPKQIKYVLDEINGSLNPKQILVSMAAGVSLNIIHESIKVSLPIFRAIPNTAIAVQQSMTCLATRETSKETIQQVTDLYNLLGVAIIIEEELMAAATVLGSCGTAFALRYIRAAMQGGIEMGFNSDLAQLIAAQTVKGAAELLLEGGSHPEKEIDKVTTPQGITISGLNEMEHQGFSSALIKGHLNSFNKLR